ncbi:MAG: hypothetical protein ABR537_10900 [Gemmatimonadales bacterium]
MKRMLIIVGLLFGLATGVAQAQTRVGVSLSFGDPYFNGQVVIGRPYYHRYSRPYYYRYHPTPVIVVGPRYHRAPRVVVVRSHRTVHRHHRGW